MRDMTDSQFRKIAETRMAQMKEWKAIPENKRPTWEQFKRGLKVKKEVEELNEVCDEWKEESMKAQDALWEEKCECEICGDTA